MKLFNLGLLAVSASLIASCTSDHTGSAGTQQTAVTFASGVKEFTDYTTRVNQDGDKWLQGDKVGIYMLENGTTVIANAAENVLHSAKSAGKTTTFECASPMYYPEDETAVEFIAYHPYSTAVTDMCYPVDLHNQSAGSSEYDLMYARNNGEDEAGHTKASTSAIELTFEHMLSKIVLNVTAADGGTVTGATIKGMNTAGVFDLCSGTITNQGTMGPITPYNASSDSAVSYEAILLPVTLSPSHTVEFTLNGVAKEWVIENHTTATDALITEFAEGMKYTFNVTVSSSGVEAVAVEVGDGSTTPWVDGGTGSGNATPDEGPITGNVELDMLYGYATVGAGTTGGEGATAENIHHFDNGDKFCAWLKLREKNKSTTPAIVWLSGTFTKEQGRATSSPWFDIKRTSNITIYGTDGFKMENVGFFINNSSNIIIRNIYIELPKADNGADGISMQSSNNIWVDHCTFKSMNQTSDYEDGSCDITHATYNVTVSWCHFITTQKSCLVGHSNSATADVAITATFHHNFFDKSSSRHPRVRFGNVHVYNNYFNEVTTYGVGSAYGAKVLVENNTFEAVRLPIDICTYPAKKKSGSTNTWVSNLTGSVAGYVYEAGNLYNNRPADATDPYPFTNVEYVAYNGETLATPLTYYDFVPPYSYVVDDAEDIAEIVPSGAGIAKLSGYSSAPVAVDNGGISDDDIDSGGDDDTGEEEEVVAIAGGWSLANIGSAAGAYSVSGGTLTLTGVGKYESGGQTFAYVYREITGDFEMTVRVDSYTAIKADSNQALAGILITPDITVTGNYFVHGLNGKTDSETFYNSYRLSAEASRGSSKQTLGSGSGDIYLKLVRSGSTYQVSNSMDGGVTYGSAKTSTFTDALPETIYVGLAVNSGDSSKSGTAVFSDVTINGESFTFTED